MFTRLAPVLLALACASTAFAQHSGDVFLEVEGDTIVTGAIDDDNTIVTPVYVFAAEFGDSGFPEFTSNPGFDSLPETFDPDSRVGWNATAGFTVWNGAGFDPTDGEQLEITFLTSSFVVFDAPSAGFDLQVQEGGNFHRHLNFFLSNDSGDPDPGVYLLQFELYNTDPTVESSADFWIVFDYQAGAGEHDAAIQWVVDNLAPVDTCPGDVDGDGMVAVSDLLELIAAWGTCGSCAADLTGDGLVDIADLLLLLSVWGGCAP